jgi:hypothetical protein
MLWYRWQWILLEEMFWGKLLANEMGRCGFSYASYKRYYGLNAIFKNEDAEQV